jgi:hypothetical protein
MQTFDGELERLIAAGVIDREVGLSYATNRTNLLLRLETQSGGAASEPVIGFKDARPGDARLSGAHRKPPAPAPAPPPPKNDFDDLIER